MFATGDKTMAIYDYLISYGQFDSLVSFNGQLKDYLNIYANEKNRKLLEMMLEENENLYVYTNFGLKFNMALIANKQIGYKDAKKIDDNSLKVPYIIYWKNEDLQRALVINTNSYIEAKGMFFSLTEVDNYFEDDKNDLIAVYLNQDNRDEVIEVFKEMLNGKHATVSIQRKLDNKYINDVDLMKEQCIKISQDIFEETIETILPLESGERKPYIDKAIARAFILKKALYVRYMSNKHLLNERHFGKVSQQRIFAKSYISEIPIVPYFKLFNM